MPHSGGGRLIGRGSATVEPDTDRRVMKSQVEVQDPVTDRILDEWLDEPAPFLSILHAIQDHYGYLPEPALRRVSQRMDIPHQ